MNKKVLAVAVSSALAAPMAAHAVKYKLSGQINRAAVYQNDGDNSDVPRSNMRGFTKRPGGDRGKFEPKLGLS